jgi:hypothetical protein
MRYADDEGFRSLTEVRGASVVGYARSARSLGVDPHAPSEGVTATLVLRRGGVTGWVEVRRPGRGRLLGPLHGGAAALPPLPAPAPDAPEILPPAPPARGPLDDALEELDALVPLVRVPEARVRLRRVREALLAARGTPASSSAAVRRLGLVG